MFYAHSVGDGGLGHKWADVTAASLVGGGAGRPSCQQARCTARL